MYKYALFFIALSLSSLTLACDENCKRDKVSAKLNIQFAPHLNAKYCQSTTNDFLLNARNSLDKYKENQLPTAHRGGARNIRNYINSRKEWLRECDDYLQAMDLGNVFRKKDTTQTIFKLMDEVSLELEKITKRPANKAENINEFIEPAQTKFDNLFKHMDAHVIELQKRGIM